LSGAVVFFDFDFLIWESSAFSLAISGASEGYKPLIRHLDRSSWRQTLTGVDRLGQRPWTYNSASLPSIRAHRGHGLATLEDSNAT
jgi:hypothetical protein